MFQLSFIWKVTKAFENLVHLFERKNNQWVRSARIRKLCRKVNCVTKSFRKSFLWAIYILPGSVCLLCWSQKGRPIPGIYKSLTDTWLQELGTRPRSFISWEYINRFSIPLLCARGMTWIQKRLKEKDTETIIWKTGGDSDTGNSRTTMTPTIPAGASTRNNSKQDKIRDGHDYRDYLQEQNRTFGRVCEAVVRVAWGWKYINHSRMHECRNRELGRAVSFLGIHQSDFRCSVWGCGCLSWREPRVLAVLARKRRASPTFAVCADSAMFPSVSAATWNIRANVHRTIEFRRKSKFLPSSVQCCGSGMFIPEPGQEFVPSRIPDPHKRI